FAQFVSAVETGESQTAALQRIFGKSFSDVIVELKNYLERPMLPVVEYSVALGEGAKDLVVSVLSDIDGELAYAQLALDCGRPREADPVYQKLKRNKPDSARLATALATVPMAQKPNDEARSYFDQALHFPDAPAEPFFEYAMLVRDTGGNRIIVPRNQQKAVDRNPNSAEALFLLGGDEANEGRHAEALPHLEQAA